MKTYISILRGINVSGKNLIRMDLLKEVYSGLGFTNTTTYIQSGNVVFQAEETSLEILEKNISAAIVKRVAFEVPVILIEKRALINILEKNPFIKEFPDEIDKLHITFLSHAVEEKYIENIKNTNFLPDRFVANEKAIYLYCPNGYGKTKLNNNFFESKLKVVATTRNLKTIKELVKISFSL